MGCRLLFGSIRMQSYDWLEGGPSKEPNDVAPAECIRSEELSGGSLASLYPDEGNVHAFQASTPAAVLDVLIPGYTGGALALLLRTVDNVWRGMARCYASSGAGGAYHRF